MNEKKILVTGATGYVGGSLVPQLLNAGYRVRALGRSVSKLKGRPWSTHPLVELAAGDVLDKESLIKGLRWLLGRLLPGPLHDRRPQGVYGNGSPGGPKHGRGRRPGEIKPHHLSGRLGRPG